MPATECVLITGASSGIGEELARLFAKDGAEVVLVARREEKLQELAKELESQYGTHATVIAMDLAKPDGAQKLCESLSEREIEVDVLVNNAGFGILGLFQDSKWETQRAMIAVNISALTELTHRLLPKMLARRRGGILNVSSVAAFPPGPLMAVYYASKAFVQSFSDALREELRGTPISVTSLAPGPVSTEFASRSGIGSLGFFDRNSLPAKQVAAAGYQAFRRKKRNCTPGLFNRIGTIATRTLPRAISARIVARVQGRKLE